VNPVTVFSFVLIKHLGRNNDCCCLVVCVVIVTVHSCVAVLVVVKVRLSVPSTSTYCADVVMATKPGSVYDVAVLKIRHFHCRSQWPNRLSISYPVEG